MAYRLAAELSSELVVSPFDLELLIGQAGPAVRTPRSAPGADVGQVENWGATLVMALAALIVAVLAGAVQEASRPTHH